MSWYHIVFCVLIVIFAYAFGWLIYQASKQWVEYNNTMEELRKLGGKP